MLVVRLPPPPLLLLLLLLLPRLAAAALTLRVRDGTLLTPPHAGEFVGTHKSQLQRRVLALFPAAEDYAKTSLLDQNALRHLCESIHTHYYKTTYNHTT